MKDPGAGGGIDSHMPTHRRQDSSEEPVPDETAAETRNPAPEQDQETFPQPLQEFPRGSQVLVKEAASAETTVVEVAPPLSRSCSTSSNLQPTEYSTVQPSERRPSPLGRSALSATHLPLVPPVTISTLSELDVHRIINNYRLRHDINFDPLLHFRPNKEGPKGRSKEEKASQFWSRLQHQLIHFVEDREGFLMDRARDANWCLPSLLRAVKEIIQTLVPQRDRDELNEGLDVGLLMQEFYNGRMDLEKTADWLSRILKRHCAPMRDGWVDGMRKEICEGTRNNDIDELVKGLRSLLSVVEAMKLDVANHQIRCLRAVLIDDTVNFEQRFFIKRIHSGKADVREATAWYRDAQLRATARYAGAPMPYSHEFGDTAVFFDAFLRLVLPSSTEKIPPTFAFDEDRVTKLRFDAYDSICLEICMRKFDDLDRLPRAWHGFGSGGSLRSNRSSTDFNLDPFSTSRPSSFALSDRGSVNASPRSSGGLFAEEPVVSRPKPQDVYNSLLGLLDTEPPASTPSRRWASLAQPMALQIYRHVNSPHCSLPDLEAELLQSLTNVQADIFCEVQQSYRERLLGELATRVKEFRNLSGLGIFNRATGGRIQPADRRDLSMLGRRDGTGSSRDRQREEAGITDMATGLAHIGVLHWRVWCEMAYDVVADSEMVGSSVDSEMGGVGVGTS